MPSDLSNWCPEVYRGLYIDRHNDNWVKIAPCCQSTAYLESVKDFKFETSPYLNSLREQFDRGEKPIQCNRCWQSETIGQPSRRTNMIKFFNNREINDDVKLESLDINATWACNLACVMCGPDLSSTWATELGLEREKLRTLGRLYQRTNEIYHNLDFSNIKKIHFNGGEPLINDEHLRILEKVREAGALSAAQISYNTNGTQYPNERTLEIWRQVHLVKLFFSIDATGPAFEYIRWPAKWHDVSENLLRMRRDLPDNVMLGFNITVGLHNVFELPELANWFSDNFSSNRGGDASDWCWQIAFNFDTKFLRSNVKEEAIETLKKHPLLEGIGLYIKNQINYTASDDWIMALDLTDQRRKTEWRKSLAVAKYYRQD